MIKINNLSVHFQNEIIFNDFNFTLKKGERLAIIGKSGSGKSTLLHLLAGFIPHFEGDVRVGNLLLCPENINKIRQLTTWLPQDISLKFSTVEELFFAPFEFEYHKNKRPNEESINEIFDAFELSPKLLLKNLKEISGGQKQRIILASTLLLHQPIFLMDEPTSALDPSIKKKVTDYIFKQHNLTIIAATHDNYWIERSSKVLHLQEKTRSNG